MLHRSLLVIFLSSLYSIGNAGQSPQLPPPIIVPQSQEPTPFSTPSAKQPDVVKPDIPKVDTVKPEEVKPGVVKPEEVTLPATPAAPVTPAVPTIAPKPESNIAELLPHRATYSITLDKNYYDEDVADAKGEMTIQLAKAGDGWVIEQKSTLHIYYKDESAEQVITSLAGWVKIQL
jgi:hypothetical protein